MALPRPDITAAEAEEILSAHYGLSGTLAELGSQQDRNYRVDTGERRYVLKICHAAYETRELEAQNAALDHLKDKEGAPRVPGVVAATDGREIVALTVREQDYQIRLLDYLEGEGLTQRFADIVAEVASPDVKPALASLLDPATAIPEQVYRDAIETYRPKLIELYRGYFASRHVDAVVFPTSPLPPPLIGEDETVVLNGRAVPTFTTVVRNTGPGSNAGIPGLSIPVGLTSGGLPVGLEFDGPAGRDRDLLALALAVESLFALPAAP